MNAFLPGALALCLIAQAPPSCSQSAGNAPPPPAAIPRGVFSLGYSGKAWQQKALESPDVIGMSLRYGWADLEPTEGSFNFGFIDSEITRAALAHKQVLLRIMTMAGRPGWVDTAVTLDGGKFFTWIANGQTVTIPVFWDPTYLDRKLKMIIALGAHFAGNTTITIVCVSFANATSEDWNVPHKPAEVLQWQALGYTTDKMLATSQAIIGTTLAAFPSQFATLSLGGNGHVKGNNLDPEDAFYLARTAIANARAAWPGRLIVQMNSLATVTPPAPGPVQSGQELLYASRPDVAFQDLAACGFDGAAMNGGVPGDPTAILKNAVDIAVDYGANYVEIYQGDVVGLPAAIGYARVVLGGD